MFQQYNLLPLFIFMFWSCCVSDPQIHLLSAQCNPPDSILVSSFVLTGRLNGTFRDIRGQIRDKNKHLATAQQGSDSVNPVYTLFQCRNYLSIDDCLACFDVAADQIRNCAATPSLGAYAVYDGCFIRYNYNTFFNEARDTFSGVSCGNETTGGDTAFTEATQQVLTNLQRSISSIPSFFVATKIQAPNNGSIIYAFAQCVDTITTSGCQDCLNAGYSNLQICLPFSDGRAFDAGCFMRYSTTSIFPDNQTIDITTSVVKQGTSSNKGATIGGVSGGVALIALILLALFSWIKRRRTNKMVSRGNHLRSDLTGVSKLKGPITYSYKDLVLATKNFSEENKLGEGGFGAVFKGTLKNGKVVAVKKLTSYHSNKMEEDFKSEVTLINNVHHRNLVRLLGCCSKGRNRILIYEYMKNSSLDRFLFGKKKGSLNWKQRYDIILGIARGLTYLHEEFHVRIIHRDIKTNNILLDDDLQPRIADFGLARLLPEGKSHVSTKLAGTLGYTAPEYAIHGQLSEKADIYSYGVVILEIISGQKCRELNLEHHHEGAFLLQKAWNLYEKGRHFELVDKTLKLNGYDAEEVKKIIEIGLLCIQASADTRPMMSEVVILLQNKDLSKNIKPTMPILIETN